MNKKFIIILSLFSFHFSLFHSEAQTMRDVFKAVPDSVLPTLTTNNRLDMIDFMDAKMKAEVTNLLDGKSEMLFLSDDSLAIRMSDAMLMEMRVSGADTIKTVSIRQTYQTTIGKARQTVETLYEFPSWRRVSAAVLESTLLRRDDKLKDKAVSF